MIFLDQRIHETEVKALIESVMPDVPEKFAASYRRNSRDPAAATIAIPAASALLKTTDVGENLVADGRNLVGKVPAGMVIVFVADAVADA
jgi:hypothetical protein